MDDDSRPPGGRIPPHRLEPVELIAALAPETRQKLISFACFDVLASTNQYLIEKGAVPPGVFALCIAASQTRGRGRRGRSWVSPGGGNVYLSLGWRGFYHTRRDNWVGLVIAVELARYLSGLSASFVGVKWPNDLYCQEGKLGGILIEKANGLYVAGFGLNVAMDEVQAGDIDQRWTSLKNIGVEPGDCRMIAAPIAGVIIKAVGIAAGASIPSMQELYRPFDLARGRDVKVRGNGGHFCGVAEGLDDDGLLRVKTAAGVKTCHWQESSIRL